MASSPSCHLLCPPPCPAAPVLPCTSTRRPACPPAGLSTEGSEVAALEAQLAAIQQEQAQLPGLVREVGEALEAEAAAYERQDAGERVCASE